MRDSLDWVCCYESNMTSKHTGPHAYLVILTLLFGSVLMGCYDPLDHTSGVAEQKLRTIETFEEVIVPLSHRQVDANEPVVSPAERSMSIGECRAVALANNLDLDVELLDPSIAAETITEEQAQFESLFFSNLGHEELDVPDGTLDKTSGGDVGVAIPLRTGGELTIELGYERFHTTNEQVDPDTSHNTDFSFSISHPLLRNAGLGVNAHPIRIAFYETQISEARAKLEVIRVLSFVDQVYWRLYAARGELQVRQQEYDLAVAQLERVERRVKAGTSPKVEIIRSAAGVAARRETIVIAENNVRQRELDLKLTINTDELDIAGRTVLIPATKPNPIDYHFDHKRLIEAAIENRMEMLELELRLAQDASTIEFRQNQLLPLLAVDYTYKQNTLGRSRPNASDIFGDNDFTDHRLGLQLQIPLGNKAARSRLRRAVLGKVRRLATVRRRETQIKREVLGAIIQLESAWERIEAARQRPVLAARELAAEQRQFELGRRTSVDVLEAQQRLANAHLAEINALADYEIAQTRLAFSTGTTLMAAQIHWQPKDE